MKFRSSLNSGLGNLDMSKTEDELKAELYKPRPIFLIAAGICASLAFFTYFLEDSIVAPDGQGALTFAFILISLVFGAMLLLLCYRNPRLGNKILGYDVLPKQSAPSAKSDVQYSAGFKSETGLDSKHRNTQRKQARHSRKKLAEVTRKMQQEKADGQDATNTPKE
jgi:hypothetical protein